MEIDTILHMDALDFLQGLPNESADLFFTDPPYNLGYQYQAHQDAMTQRDYYQWCYDWLDQACRILKPTGSLMVLNIPDHAITLAAYLKTRLHFQHWITWKAASRSSHKPLMPEHYALLWFTKSDQFTSNDVRYPHKRCRNCGEMVADYGGKKHLAHVYGPLISDVWTDIGRAKHSERGEHPCKLPPKFVERVIRLASNPGDIVVDPFMGAGTTALVAKKLGRRYAGSDNSEAYVEMARNQPYNLPIVEMLG